MSKMNKDEVAGMLKTGKTYAEIGREYGVSRQAVYDFCKRYKVDGKLFKGKVKHKSLLAERIENFDLPQYYASAAEKFRRKKANCKHSKWEFTIEMSDIAWPTHCPILGLELLYESPFDKKEDASVSFDRRDSSKGYVPGNVQIISWRANRIKNDGTAEEHELIAKHMKMSMIT